jgi:hypothetical protein
MNPSSRRPPSRTEKAVYVAYALIELRNPTARR